jgi:hypothetical protein
MNIEDKNIKETEHSVLTYCGSNEPHHHAYSIPGCRQTPTTGNPARNHTVLAAPPHPQEAAAPSPPPDIEALAAKVRGGTWALMHLRVTGRPATVGALVHSVRQSFVELDVPAFLTCGAVYREDDLIYPVGYTRLPGGSFIDPKELPF